MEKLFNCIKERAGYEDEKILCCWGRIENVELHEFVSGRYCYHKDCYKKATNTTEINRSKERYEKKQSRSRVELPNVANDDNLVSNSSESTPILQKKSLRSSVSLYDKTTCIICQTEGGKLHKVCFKSTGERMLEVAKKLLDRSFFLRLHSIPSASDAVANDVQYHRTCWVLAQRSANVTSTTAQNLEDIDRVLANIEIVNMVQDILNESPDTVLDMKSLNITYNNMIESPDKEVANYKRYLKQLLQENIPEAVFIRPPARNESERVCSSHANSSAIEKTFKNSWDNYSSIFEAAKMVRKDVIEQKKWQFKDTFNGFTIPQSLKSILHWVITGPKHEVDRAGRKKDEIDRSVNMVAEIIMNLIKTDRQVNYQSRKGDDGQYCNVNETPFTVGLGLHVHKTTRSKKLVNFLSNINLSLITR